MDKLLRLPEVLNRVQLSRSTWYSGIRAGIFPKPVKLTERTSGWKESQINALVEGNRHIPN
jgi:prophage regulatory protein